MKEKICPSHANFLDSSVFYALNNVDELNFSVKQAFPSNDHSQSDEHGNHVTVLESSEDLNFALSASKVKS